VARLDYDRAAGVYQATRTAPLERLDPWRTAIMRYLPAATTRVLDLGAGTGIWAAGLATWFDVGVIAIEPSAAMRREAAASRDRRVWYAGGRSEAIPVRTGSCGAAWLSTVIHHIEDLGAAASELRRVLEPGAPVLIRSSFPGRHDEILLFRFFAAAGRVASTFPTVDETVAAFVAAGFEEVALERVREASVSSLREFRERVATMRQADSTLAPLTDAEFAEGVAALDRAIVEGVEATPVGLDLLVLRAPARR